MENIYIFLIFIFIIFLTDSKARKYPNFLKLMIIMENSFMSLQFLKIKFLDLNFQKEEELVAIGYIQMILF